MKKILCLFLTALCLTAGAQPLTSLQPMQFIAGITNGAWGYDLLGNGYGLSFTAGTGGFTGSGAGLTGIPAANVTGTFPATVLAGITNVINLVWSNACYALSNNFAMTVDTRGMDQFQRVRPHHQQRLHPPCRKRARPKHAACLGDQL